MSSWVNGRVNEWMAGSLSVYLYGGISGRGGWMVVRMYVLYVAGRWLCDCMCGCVSGCIVGWMAVWMCICAHYVHVLARWVVITQWIVVYMHIYMGSVVLVI